jgi:hypothetical protein
LQFHAQSDAERKIIFAAFDMRLAICAIFFHTPLSVLDVLSDKVCVVLLTDP